MKRPFDTIVGPDGVWRDERAADGGSASGAAANETASAGGTSPAGGATASAALNERERFALRCLNAAANLYGVLTMAEFVSLYNGYAKSHPAPVSDEMTVEGLGVLLDRLHAYFRDRPEPDGCESLSDRLLDEDEIWFSTWRLKADEPCVIVYSDLTTRNEDATPPRAEAERRRRDDEAVSEITREIEDTMAGFREIDLLVLPEDDFLVYEEPMAAEDTKESRAFERFLKKEYRCDRAERELDTLGIQCNARVNGAKIVTALEYVRDACDWEPSDDDALDRLVKALGPLLGVTRTWEGRGRTPQELCRQGFSERVVREEIYDVFGFGNREGDGGYGGHDFDEADDGDYIQAEDVPVSAYVGPIDFRFVKDAAKRDAKLAVYDDVRQVTQDFVRRHVMRELTQEERRKAAVRLGFLKEGESLDGLDPTLDCVAGDFASMMDDQGDGPAIRRALAKRDDLDDVDARAASYYENYRYTWLEVLAAKSGVGVKCRDLLTGEELFLMEKSLSCGDVKGMTICAGIAPMEDVYIAVGVISPARFESPATILRIVLAHLGLPTELPVRLDAADQARFAAETIRRVHANGNYGLLAYS